jgi:PIN domain nuclease of toxin-antitoxin system
VKLLLDTCAFLWIAGDSPELTREARDLFQDPDNEVFLSAASAWEIAIKHSLGKLSLPEAPDRFVPARRKEHRVQPLSVDEEAALHLFRLPGLHRDPFDRILVCQAMVGGMAILTPDPLIQQYPVRTLW